MVTPPRLLASVCSLLLLLAAGAPADAAKKKKFDATFRADLFFDYTDNFFRLSSEELAEFDQFQAPGERFFNMDSPEDVIVRLRLRGDFDWKVAKKRKVRLMVRGAYFGHARNKVSDYPRLEIALSGDVTRSDRLYGSLDMIYDRFWRNLRVSDTSIFAPGIYDQVDARLGYVRQIKKRWAAGLEYRHRKRRYEHPFEVRDRDGDYLAGSTEYAIARRAAGGTVLQYGVVETNTETLASGVLIDRSYDEALVGQRFEVRLARRANLDIALQYRQRNFTTDEMRDDARFDRVDRRYRYGFAVSYEALKNLLVEARYRYTDNDSDRIDPTADSDQLGYTENRVGIGVRYKY